MLDFECMFLAWPGYKYPYFLCLIYAISVESWNVLKYPQFFLGASPKSAKNLNVAPERCLVCFSNITHAGWREVKLPSLLRVAIALNGKSSSGFQVR